jgi:diguanylate cyclase (GGDEF)-like protein/hemerythrin-like metal-binding protein/PAS domain S-box-containing protein
MPTLLVTQDMKSFFPRPQKGVFLYLLLLFILPMSASAAPLQKVTLQLRWFHQFQLAGYHAARMKGYYQYAGRDVTILDTKPGINVVDEVVSSSAISNIHDLLNKRDMRASHSKEDRLSYLLYLFIAAILVVCGLNLSVVAIFMRINRKLINESKARALATAEMEESEHNLRFITENSADVIWTMDITTRQFTYISPSIYNLLGYTVEEVIMRSAGDLMTSESSTRAFTSLTESIERWNAGDRSDTRKVTEIDQYHKDGRIISIEVVTTLHTNVEGQLTSIIGISRDISERKKVDAAIRNLAFYDSLTNLPNRRLLLDRLEQAITQAKRNKLRMALLFIDLDKFKPVNDQYGHEVGDWLLKAVATRMQTCLRESDTAARIGGDEFIVLLPDIQKSMDAKLVAEKIRSVLNQPFEMASGLKLNISACIGISLYPDHGRTEKQLMKNGDTAMYQAKESGRNRVWVYQRSRDDRDHNEYSYLRLKWKKSYELGDPTIDGEHKMLFHLAGNLISAAIDRDNNQAEFEAAFNTLIVHVEHHFANEEAILAIHAYDDLETHARLHCELLHQANTLYHDAVENKTSIGVLIDFIINDLVKVHFFKVDRKFYYLFSDALIIEKQE